MYYKYFSFFCTPPKSDPFQSLINQKERFKTTSMKFIYSLLILLLFLSMPAWSQLNISGLVTDGLTGAAVPQAKVEAASMQTLTGADGHFMLQVSDPGDYTLMVTLDGYEKASIPVKVTKGTTDIGKITLSPSLTEAEAGISDITLSGESDDKDES